MKYFRIIFLFIFLVKTFFLFSQTPHFEQYKPIKNKKNYEVYSIVQDSTGYMWFGTSVGLLRFDGTSTIAFPVEDKKEQSSISSLNVDYTGALWIGNKDGSLYRIENQKAIPFTAEEGLSKSPISSIFFDKDSILWFSTLGEGVYWFDGKFRKRLYNLNSDDGLGDNYSYCISQSKEGLFYIGTDNGISVYDKNKKFFVAHYTMKDGLPDNIVKHLQFDATGKLWIATDQSGMCTLDLKTKKFDVFPWEYGSINNFIIQPDGDIWISTQSDGILKSSTKKAVVFKQFGETHGIHCNKTEQIFSDFENNVWVGCKSGISKCLDNTFEFLDQRENFYRSDIFSFITDKQGHYWVACSEGLFVYKKDEDGLLKEERLFSGQNELSTSFVSLYESEDGFIWAGTYGYGVFKINPQTHASTRYTTKNGLNNDNVISISGKGSKIWFSTLGGGANYISGNEIFKGYNRADGLPSNYVYSVFVDSKKRSWFALDGGGFAYLQNDAIIHPKLPDSLKMNLVYSFAEDKNGNIWFISPDKGLFRFDGKNYFQMNSINGLNIADLKSIVADQSGNILLVNSEGLQLIDVDLLAVESFSEQEGLGDLNPVVNGIHKDDNGSVWITNSNSIIIYKYLLQERSKITPEISVQSVQLFFQSIGFEKRIFSHSENHLSFNYSGFWFQNPDKLQYRFMLENYDYTWSAITKSKFVTYSNLPPGKYTFHVQVSHRPGMWIEGKNASYSFEIRPPFWRTWWFISLMVIAVSALIFAIFKIRVAKLKHDKAVLEEEVVKRTATIMQQKEEIETQRDEIEAQRDFVTQQRDKISAQNVSITDSIQYASRIQKAVMPSLELIGKYANDYFVLNRPMHIVSGDFYWCAEKNDRLILAVADCTGHGVPGAFMSMLGITLLSDIVNNHSQVCAAEILNNLRDMVKTALRQKGLSGEAQDGMDIAIVILDSKTNTLDYAGANNPLYVIRNRELLVYKPNKMPIGIYVQETPFEGVVVELQKEDQVYLFSDGYVDQLGGERDSKFKSRAFQELLLEIADKSMTEKQEILNTTMDKWKNGRSQNDDIMIIGFSI